MAKHEGGHLPIMAEVSNHLSYGNENLVTVAINNTLTPTTIPQGAIHYHDDPTRCVCVCVCVCVSFHKYVSYFKSTDGITLLVVSCLPFGVCV